MDLNDTVLANIMINKISTSIEDGVFYIDVYCTPKSVRKFFVSNVTILPTSSIIEGEQLLNT